MIEDYGTLSEQELLEEILQELEEHENITTQDLEFKFEDGQMVVMGALPSSEELENLVSILEDHIESNDYRLEIELPEGEQTQTSFTSNSIEDSQEDEYVKENLSDLEEDEMDFVDDDTLDDDKW